MGKFRPPEDGGAGAEVVDLERLTLDLLEDDGVSSVDVGKSGEVVFVLVNGGTRATGPLTTSIQGRDAAEFDASAQPCRTSLAANARCRLPIVFRPTSLGPKLALLLVEGASGDRAMAIVEATGTGQARLVASLPRVDFGAVSVGAAPATASLTLSNAGILTTGPLTFTLSAPFSISPPLACPALAPAEKCLLTVTFAPVAVGTFSDVLAISGVASEVRLVIPTAGLGLRAFSLVVTPSPIDVAPVVIGGMTDGIVTVTTKGGVPTSTAITPLLDGKDRDDFSLLASSCGLPLARDGKCEIRLRFAPKTVGTKAAALRVEAEGQSTTADISAIASPPIPLAPVLLSPRAGAFEARVGTVSRMRNFTVTNTTGAPGKPIVQVVGDPGAQFETVGSACDAGTDLAAGASCSLALRLRSSNAGPVTASLVASVGAVSDFVPLTGTGVVMPGFFVTPDDETVRPGQLVPYRATLVLMDGSAVDLTAMVTWSSSNAAVASVSNALPGAGNLVGTGLGTATISAIRPGGQTASTNVTVMNLK